MPIIPITPAKLGGAGIGRFRNEKILPNMNPDRVDNNANFNSLNLLNN